MRFKLIPLFGLLLAVSALSCQKEISGDEIKFAYDKDAQRFIDAAQLKDSTTQMAINDFVIDLKKFSLWNRFTAIYPVVGGTAESVKWNLKDPRDTDDAFRLTLHGNPVIAETGILFPTIADYADTHLTDSMLQYNNNSISFYSRTQNNVSGYDMGCHDNLAPYSQMAIYHANNATDYFGLFRYGYKPDNTKGLFMISATQDNVVWFENGINTFAKGGEPTEGFTGYPMLIGWCQNALSGGERECGLATVGMGLNEAEAKSFNDIVANFQEKLSRQVL